MQKNKMPRCVYGGLILIGLAVLLAPSARAEKLDQLHIHRFEPPEIRALATSLVQKWLRENDPVTPDAWRVAPPGWSGRLLDLVDVGEIILSDDSFVLLFLQIAIGDACGTVGCDTYIYRKTPTGYVKICEAMMYEDIIFLKARENGYHLIDAGESIIHWSKVRDKKTGDLCYEKAKPGFE